MLKKAYLVIKHIFSIKYLYFITLSLKIQIDTHNEPKYVWNSFVAATSAFLVEYYPKNGIIPHLDAVNKISCKIPLKLGFTIPLHSICYFWSKEHEMWEKKEVLRSLYLFSIKFK